LEIGANVVSSDPTFGMGMDFIMVPTEQWNKLPQVIEKVTDGNPSPAAQPVELSELDTGISRITQETAPDTLDRIIKRINEKGILTKQEILDIVNSSQ
jgi:hypothetical protein